MLALLREAAKDGNELHAFEASLITPEWVLTYEKNNQDMINLADQVRAFEVAYREALVSYIRIANDVSSELARRRDRQSSYQSLRRGWSDGGFSSNGNKGGTS